MHLVFLEEEEVVLGSCRIKRDSFALQLLPEVTFLMCHFHVSDPTRIGSSLLTPSRLLQPIHVFRFLRFVFHVHFIPNVHPPFVTRDPVCSYVVRQILFRAGVVSIPTLNQFAACKFPCGKRQMGKKYNPQQRQIDTRAGIWRELWYSEIDIKSLALDSRAQ